MASAELGFSHHRFFVMRRVLSMCGANLDEPVARRVAIEIKAQEKQRNFATCVSVLNRSIAESYHPRIAEAIQPSVNLR